MDHFAGLTSESLEISSLKRRIEAIENFLVTNFPENVCIKGGEIASKKEVEAQKEREEKIEKRKQQIREKYTDEDISKHIREIVCMTDQMKRGKSSGELE